MAGNMNYSGALMAELERDERRRYKVLGYSTASAKIGMGQGQRPIAQLHPNWHNYSALGAHLLLTVPARLAMARSMLTHSTVPVKFLIILQSLRGPAANFVCL